MTDRIPTAEEMERLWHEQRSAARRAHEREEMSSPVKEEPKRGVMAKVLGLFRRQP